MLKGVGGGSGGGGLTVNTLPAALTTIGEGVPIVASPNTDISAKIIAAQTTLGAAGGRISIPAGVFFVQNVPLIDGIYYEGAGETVTQLKLPNGATASMFVAATNLNTGWGFKNIYFSGIYNSTFYGINSGGGANITRSIYNCIDFTAATTVNQGTIENCWFEYFNAGFAGPAAGSAGTNFVYYVAVKGCTFQYNNIGITFGEHVHPSQCFFMFNGITNGSAFTGGGGITGRLNDCTIQRCWFLSNYQGIFRGVADNGSVFNTQILGCLFAANQQYDIVANNSCIISNNAFWAFAGYATAAAIVLLGPNHTITGNKFNEPGAYYTGACIQLQDGNVSTLFTNLIISANWFNLANAAAGPAIDFTTGIQNAGSVVQAFSVSANTAYTNRTQFLKCATVYNSCGAITGNTFYLTGDYTTATAIALIEMYTVSQVTATGNAFYTTGAATKANIFGGTIQACAFTANTLTTTGGSTCNMFLAGTNITGATIQNNPGYKTRNSGVAALAAATSVVVTHGLANTPNIQDIVLTSDSAAIVLPPYPSNITSTQFTINYPGLAVSGNVGWIASCNN